MKNCFFFILFLLLISSCKEDPPIIPPPPPPEPKITLSLDDVSCTEAWLNLKLENVTLPVDLELKKDSIVTKTFFAINSIDTTLFVDSLLPNKNYSIQAFIHSTNHSELSSNQLSVTTIDTTSHNFTWQTFEFGQHSSSTLYDVAIIDENNIWAVGEIYMNDSLGNPDPNAYNAVHWDGSEWSIKKISVLYRGNLITPQLYGIFALSNNEIWLSSGVPIKGDGTNWQQYHLFDMGVLTQQDGYLTKIWCSSSTDIYFVGTLGTIAHYNGSKWTKIESGTTFNCRDVYGRIGNDGELRIFVAVNDNTGGNNNRIIRINPGFELDTLTWAGNTEINSLWFYNSNNFYTCGDGLWNRKNNGQWIRNSDVLPYFKSSIRGNGHNDIYVVGVLGFAYHFNGVSWNRISELSGVEVWAEVNCKNQIVAVAGSNGAKAVVTIGIHN